VSTRIRTRHTIVRKESEQEIKLKVEELLITDREQMENRRRSLWEKTQDMTVESATEMLLKQIGE